MNIHESKVRYEINAIGVDFIICSRLVDEFAGLCDDFDLPTSGFSPSYSMNHLMSTPPFP